MTRQMGVFDVYQRTKDEMFDATSLAKQWNSASHPVKGRKDVSDFLRLDKTKEFITTLENDSDFDTGKIVSVSRGGNNKNQGTWMHPLLFIDFAMWLNPSFKLQVLKFVYDQLIGNRKLAGNNYNLLSASGVKLKGYNFSEIAVAMQWIVFGTKGKNLRQSATEVQLKELYELEQKLSFAIDMGYIKSYDQLLSEMRKIWNQKNTKF